MVRPLAAITKDQSEYANVTQVHVGGKSNTSLGTTNSHHTTMAAMRSQYLGVVHLFWAAKPVFVDWTESE